MDFEQLSAIFGTRNVSFEQIETIIGSSDFKEASRLGVEYAKTHKYEELDYAPFCIDKVDASATRVVFADSLKELIKSMNDLAVDESDRIGKRGSHHEASYCFVGERIGDTIVIREGFWDSKGFTPNRLFADPDGMDGWGNIFSYVTDANETSTSAAYERKIKEICAEAGQDGSLVVIYGHTHPQMRKYKKINNYPSREDIKLAVEEAVSHYAQENGTCTFLNAIITADGDLNIFGYDVQTGKFEIYDKVQYETAGKIKTYTEGDYPIAPGPSGFGG